MKASKELIEADEYVEQEKPITFEGYSLENLQDLIDEIREELKDPSIE